MRHLVHEDVARQHIGHEGVDGGAVDDDELPRQAVQRVQLGLQPEAQRRVLTCAGLGFGLA